MLIKASHLKKTYEFTAKEKGQGIFSYLFKGAKKYVHAVKDISIDIEKGEAVAFIGPNGAGKSTTIKMLAGILTPTEGEIEVCGHSPIHERKKLAYKIGLVFGQRSQLLWNLPLRDSFVLLGNMYGLSEERIDKKLSELSTIFDLTSFIDQPVRKLSLGQRMRGEVASALIHDPELVILDEPTIGLDVVSKANLRGALSSLSKKGVTLFVTSHDVGDIESLCPRTILIDDGLIQFDDSTKKLKTMVGAKKKIVLEHKAGDVFNVSSEVVCIEKATNRTVFEVDVDKVEIAEVISALMAQGTIIDLEISDLSLEEVLKELYVT